MLSPLPAGLGTLPYFALFCCKDCDDDCQDAYSSCYYCVVELAAEMSYFSAKFAHLFFDSLVSLFVPNAFIRILNVAGVILAIMAIIVPVIISWKMQETKKTNLLLKNKFGLACVFACGVAIVLLGILDLMR